MLLSLASYSVLLLLVLSVYGGDVEGCRTAKATEALDRALGAGAPQAVNPAAAQMAFAMNALPQASRF